MKHLKKLFVLTCIALITFACSSDDENGSEGQVDGTQGTVITDDIVGNWHLVKETYIYDGNTENYAAECNTEVVLEFTIQEYVDMWDDTCNGEFDYTNPAVDYSITDLNGNPYTLIHSDSSYVIAIILRLENNVLILKHEYEDGEIALEEYHRN